MKMKDITKLSDKEIAKALEEKQLALRNFRLALSGSKLKNVREGRVLRKDIARLMTVRTK